MKLNLQDIKALGKARYGRQSYRIGNIIVWGLLSTVIIGAILFFIPLLTLESPEVELPSGDTLTINQNYLILNEDAFVKRPHLTFPPYFWVGITLCALAVLSVLAYAIYCSSKEDTMADKFAQWWIEKGEIPDEEDDQWMK